MCVHLFILSLTRSLRISHLHSRFHHKQPTSANRFYLPLYQSCPDPLPFRVSIHIEYSPQYLHLHLLRFHHKGMFRILCHFQISFPIQIHFPAPSFKMIRIPQRRPRIQKYLGPVRQYNTIFFPIRNIQRIILRFLRLLPSQLYNQRSILRPHLSATVRHHPYLIVPQYPPLSIRQHQLCPTLYRSSAYHNHLFSFHSPDRQPSSDSQRHHRSRPGYPPQ